MKVKIYKADTPNANGIVYPKDELEKAVAAYNEKAVRFVTLEPYPSGDQVLLDNAIGTAELSIDDDYVVADITLLKTEKALMLDCLPQKRVLPSALGSVVEGKAGNVTIIKLVMTSELIDTGGADEALFVVENDDDTQSN